MIDFGNSLIKAQASLAIEQERVDGLLKECNVDKSQPPKDYWEALDLLRRKVKVYKVLIERSKL